MQLHGIKAEDALLTSGPEIIEWEQTRKEFTWQYKVVEKMLSQKGALGIRPISHYKC